MNVKVLSFIAIASLPLSAPASANDTLNQLQGLLGNQTTAEAATSTDSTVDLSRLVSLVSDNLDVSETQSEGGIASVMNYVQGNLSSTDYTQLASNIPGIDSLLDNVPSLSDTSTASSSSSLTGLLNKASEYSDTLKSVNDLKQQFEALGLSTDMISSFVTQISSYLNSNASEETQSLFTSGLDNLLTAL